MDEIESWNISNGNCMPKLLLEKIKHGKEGALDRSMQPSFVEI
jgi:hypothetical protein